MASISMISPGRICPFSRRSMWLERSPGPSVRRGSGDSTFVRDRASTWGRDLSMRDLAGTFSCDEPTPTPRPPAARPLRPRPARRVRPRCVLRRRRADRGRPEGQAARRSPSPSRPTSRSLTTPSPRSRCRSAGRPPSALRNRSKLVGKVAGTDLSKDSLLQDDMLIFPPDLAPGQREVAILVDAETGVAGKIGPNSMVDIVATYAGNEQANIAPKSTVVVPAARIIEVGQPKLEGGRGVQEAERRPEAGRAGHLRAHAEGAAQGHRGRELRAGGPPGAAAPERVDAAEEGRDDVRPARAAMTQHRLLLAIADTELAQSAVALMQEGEGLAGRRPRVGRRGGRPRAAPARDRRRRAPRRARRGAGHGGRARHLGQLPRGRPGPDRRRRLARRAARRHAGRPARRRQAPALARAAGGERARRRSVVAHDARARGGRGVGRRARSAAS